jgi:hypothetical protein
MNTLSKSLLPGLCKLASSILLGSAVSIHAVDRQVLTGHMPPALARLQPIDRLASTNRLKLTIGLPLRNRPALTNMLQQLYRPAPSTIAILRPTSSRKSSDPQKDYRAAIALLTNGLVVAGTHPNRTLLDVHGAVADIEEHSKCACETIRAP